MNTVYLELCGEAVYVEAPLGAAGYTETFEGLAHTALIKDDTAELIGKMIERSDR